jgi:hypothetical protein
MAAIVRGRVRNSLVVAGCRYKAFLWYLSTIETSLFSPRRTRRPRRVRQNILNFVLFVPFVVNPDCHSHLE